MATAAQRAHAIFKVKAQGRTRLVVFDTQDLSLGRSPENDLAFDDPEMSRKHVVFRRTPEGVRLEDQRTSNGTVVNGETVDHAVLNNGDVVRVGEVEISFAITTRNPASLGPAVEYASQLKGFGGAMAAGDGESTILGLGPMSGGADDEDFEVRPAGDFDLDLRELRKPASRDLDAEMSGLDDGDDLGLGLTAPASQPAAAPGPAPAAPTEPARPAADDAVWVLDDAPEAPATGPVALTLEIEGVEGEVRRWLEGLAGKTLQLPALRVKIKARDLD